MAEEPWYKDGLRFTCTQCGNCCTGFPGFVWVNDEEVAAIAEYIGMAKPEFLARYTFLSRRGRSLREKDNNDCIFFETGKGCTVYPVRPRQCRTWPFWESNITSPEAWKKTCDVCPGSGKGDLIPVEEIKLRSQVIKV